MNSSSKVCLILIAAVHGGILSDTAQAESGDPCYGLVDLSLFVGDTQKDEFITLPAEEFIANLADDEERNNFIQKPPPDGLGIDLDIDSLTNLIQEMNEDPTRVEFSQNVPEELRGIRGLSTQILLTKLLLDEHPVLYGKIREYVFDSKSKSGHIAVDMCIDREHFFHWDIDVNPDGYRVHLRKSKESPYYPNNPFPDVNLKLPYMATDPTDDRSVWKRDLDHKLHASGERAIYIRNIYYKRLGVNGIIRFDSSHHRYDVTEKSCVDLFTHGYPPPTFGQLVGNDYCLGRCEHPAVINSGGT